MSQISDNYNVGEKLKDEGKFDEAIAKFEECLQEDDKHILSHLALAVSYGKVGKHDKAVEHGKLVCELEPTDVFNFTAMSVTFQRAYAGTQNQEFIQLAEDAMAKAQELRAKQAST
jgi:tetratricopeptide (TPR) repeat protein